MEKRWEIFGIVARVWCRVGQPKPTSIDQRRNIEHSKLCVVGREGGVSIIDENIMVVHANGRIFGAKVVEVKCITGR